MLVTFFEIKIINQGKNRFKHWWHYRKIYPTLKALYVKSKEWPTLISARDHQTYSPCTPPILVADNFLLASRRRREKASFFISRLGFRRGSVPSPFNGYASGRRPQAFSPLFFPSRRIQFARRRRRCQVPSSLVVPLLRCQSPLALRFSEGGAFWFWMGVVWPIQCLGLKGWFLLGCGFGLGNFYLKSSVSCDLRSVLCLRFVKFEFLMG